MKEFHFKDFSIYLGSDVFEILLENLISRSYSRVFVLVDEHTAKQCLTKLSKYLFDIHLITIPAGEPFKHLDTAKQIWNELMEQHADRNSVLITLGGGVVGDIGGFCASTFKRGIDFIHIPTTLLSMVDSSVGGKTGIDFNGIKNAIGVIKPPTSVYINPEMLHTLPQPELYNGFAEMLKHGLIADVDYWEKLIKTGPDNKGEITSLIQTSLKIKMKIVKKDPYEKGERKLLNFGHTIGHAIESYSLANDKQPLRHGEAVAIGMICESYLSKLKAGLSGKDLKKITDQIASRYPKYSLKNVLSPELIKLMRQDKKNLNDTINFTLLKKTGKAEINYTCSDSEIASALNYYDAL